MAKEILDLDLITPVGTESLEVQQEGGGSGSSKRILLGVSGTTREFHRDFSEELLFDKNYIECDFETVTSDITYTIAASGNLVDQESVIKHTLVMDGVAAINFSGAGFNHLYGITDGEVLAAGEYDLYFAYSNGAVSVSLPGAQGGGSGDLTSANFVTRETPAGSVNSSNVTFTLANTPTAGTEQVYLNGILQEPGGGNDYTISGATITYLAAPTTGDRLRVSYMKP